MEDYISLCWRTFNWMDHPNAEMTDAEMNRMCFISKRPLSMSLRTVRPGIPRLNGIRRLMVLCVIGLLWHGTPVNAGDWPQILGPTRTGKADSERLLAQWPASGPKELWQTKVGSGFAGVAVHNNRVVIFFREGKQEVVQMLDARTGEVQWVASSPCNYRGGVSSDKGPRCVPLIHDEKVYLFGIEGLLQCLSMKDGQKIWTKDTSAEFEPLEGYFGVGSTPVISGNVLIVNVGGRDDSAVAGLDLATGATLWKSFDDAASYSSPIVARIAGKEQAMVVTRLNVISVNPADGRLLFKLPFGATGPTVNGATPVMIDNQLFLSASYRIGSLLASIGESGAKEIWRDEELLATQYATPIAIGRHLFAVDGRQDEGSGSATLKCIDLAARKVVWQQDGFDYGTLLNVGDQMLFLTCGGELIRFDASPEKYIERQRASVLTPTDSGYRLPAFSNGRLFIRDDSTLKCLQAGEIVR